MKLNAVEKVGKNGRTRKWTQKLRLIDLIKYGREVFNIYDTVRSYETSELYFKGIPMMIVCPGNDLRCAVGKVSKERFLRVREIQVGFPEKT